VECRIPGADANSYHAFAGTIAGGLHGIANRIEPPPAYSGNGYTAEDIGRVPWNLSDAIDLWEGSVVAKSAFGDDVHHHILTAAKAEWVAFNQTVTDWEMRRYFERI
jgi:glutamine synthetase